MRRRSAYDTPLKIKCEVQKRLESQSDWVSYDDNDEGRMVVCWGSNIPSTDFSLTLQDSLEFMHFKDQFQKYRVNGLKIEYEPFTYSAGSTQLSIRNLKTCSYQSYPTPNSTAFDKNVMAREVDFHTQ